MNNNLYGRSRGRRVTAEDVLGAAIFADDQEQRVINACWENRKVMASRGRRLVMDWLRLFNLVTKQVRRGRLTRGQADRILDAEAFVICHAHR